MLVRTKRTWVFAALVALLAIGLPAVIFAALHALAGHPLVWIAVVAYYATLLGLSRAWTRWWYEERGALRADETGLWLGKRHVVRREDVSHGYVLRSEGRIYVRLARTVRNVDVEVSDEAEGEELLAAMRLDSGRSVAQYSMTHGTWRASFVRAGASTLPVLLAPVLALLLGGTIPILLGSLLVGSVLTCLYAFNQMLRVSVGADGVRLRHLLERARFVPFSSIERAELDGKNVTLHLHTGERIVMHSPAGASGKPGGSLDGPVALADGAIEARKLVERIEAQLAARRARESADAPTFARAGRETDEWLREVAAATDANASYRTPAVPPEELWRIVEDTAAAPTARAGAAAALREALDDPGRVRLRAAADACAAPRLRIALETVASSESADLRGAFDTLDDHETEQRRARVTRPADR
jgi:hypothetical protein